MAFTTDNTIRQSVLKDMSMLNGPYFDHARVMAERMKQDRHTMDMKSESFRHKILAMRLRVPEGHNFPYQDLFTSLAGDRVFVFVVQDNQAVTLEDSSALFPSDTLITQLRLLDK